MPAPVEIERKYVILKPSAEQLLALGDCECSEIEQTYLRADEGVTRRVRCRIYPDRTVYTETSKRRIDSMSSYEDEREISEGEYKKLLTEIKQGTHTLRKTRYAIHYLGVCFEIDIYPEWERTCILETELQSREQRVEFPPSIKVIAEVTGNKKYSNAAMSHTFPKELI